MHEKTVLFVDDDKNILHSLNRGLMDEPYDCLFASDASEAMNILDKHPIHTVVSDLSMPGMDGLMFLSQVRSVYPQIKQILLSGHPIITQGCSKNSAATRTVTFDTDHEIHMLAKPWELSALQSLIRETFDTALS
jgi:DNA-binding NtrC family response regulator